MRLSDKAEAAHENRVLLCKIMTLLISFNF